MKKIIISLILVLLMTSCSTQKTDEATKEIKKGENLQLQKLDKNVNKKEEKVNEEIFSMKTNDITNDVGKKVEDSDADDKNTIKAVKGLDKPGAIINKKNIVLDEGGYKAVFSLKIENPNTKEVVAGIYVEGDNNGQEGYSKEIYASDFKNSKYNDFELKFNVEKDNTEVSPWVYFTGESTIYADKIKIIKLKEKNNFSIKTYDSIVFEENSLGRKTGKVIDDKNAINGKAVYVEEGKDPAHHIAFGPYSKVELAGNHKAAFRLKIDNNKIDDIVAKLEVFNANGNGINKDLIIRGKDFLKENEYQNFEINFERTDKGSMEYRIYYYGVGNLTFDNITVFGPIKKEESKVETSTGKTAKVEEKKEEAKTETNSGKTVEEVKKVEEKTKTSTGKVEK